MKEKILFIVNPISGHKDKRNFPSLVENLIDKDKYDYTITLTEYGGHAAILTKQAIEDEYDIISEKVLEWLDKQITDGK